VLRQRDIALGGVYDALGALLQGCFKLVDRNTEVRNRTRQCGLLQTYKWDRILRAGCQAVGKLFIIGDQMRNIDVAEISLH
jgi:hypothetical protein